MSHTDVRLRRFLPLFGLLIFAAGLWVLHRELAAYSYRGVLSHLEAYSLLVLLAALALTVANFLVLTGYDTMGARYVGQALPYRRIGFASFLNYSFSQALGFPLLTGARDARPGRRGLARGLRAQERGLFR